LPILNIYLKGYIVHFVLLLKEKPCPWQ